VVKAFDRSDYENKKFTTTIDDLMHSTIKANIFTSFNSPILTFIISMSTVAILWFGGLEVIGGEMKIGDISAFILYLGKISGALAMITGMINMFPRAEASANRVLELLESEPTIKQSETPIKDTEIKGQITFNHVTFGYPNSSPVLKDISFTVEPGEKLGIIGTTGSGKTTLVNLIPRFYDPSEGEILIDGVDIKQYDTQFLRKNIGTTMQKAMLFAGTIENNIRLGAMEAPEDVLIRSSEDAQAYEFITKYKEQYQTILGERGINLSGGQKQRLSMARSIMTQPKILIFDDSTSAVDMTTESKILEALHLHAGDKTVIIIAQRIKSVINADKILVLENGTVTGFGTHDELLAQNALYQEIYEAQIGGEANV
jgi:ATP-binding cassette, subfamily B, multidrug efflux pump